MNRKQARKARKLLKSLTNEQLASFNVIKDYVENQKKKQFLEGLHEDDRNVILSIIPCITFASEIEVNKLKPTPLYQKVYFLLKESEKSQRINPELDEIYKNQLAHAKNYLHILKGKLVKEILSDSYSNYQKLKRTLPEKAKTILESRIEKAKKQQQEHLKIIENLIFFCDYSPILLRLTPALLQTKLSEGDHLGLAAAIITNPKLQFLELIHLDEAWDAFPLKWYVNQLPTTAGRTLFEMFKNGHDISSVFASKYLDGKFATLTEMLSSKYISHPLSHILCPRQTVITDVLTCFTNKIFSAAICTALTIIEGLLWDFSKEYNHYSEVKIYENDDCSTLKLNSGKTMDKFTVGDLLKNTAFSDIFDRNFIAYFCDELYNERNPILHGQETTSFTMENSAKKIATIEYILTTIETFNKKQAMERIEKNMSPELKSQILNACTSEN
ncbi:hypothetical protein [Pseudomonas paraglycinae]|uniref:hypothetical protein n=1 Tax=Pseudomonas paraglycinae TaxID=2892330 RepID=UPI003FD41E91